MFLCISFFSMLILSLILLTLSLALGFRSSADREKLSPFECGFTPKFSARMPFSIRFFLISIIFLIFDVELILIFPLIPALSHSSIYVMYFSLSLVVIILLGGLFHEIVQGSLSWSN